MKKALKQAQLRPSAVDYVNAHATSTIIGDAAENAAIKALLLGPSGKHKAADVNVSSTKGAVGHLLGGAGAVEAVFSVMAIQNVSSTIYYWWCRLGVWTDEDTRMLCRRLSIWIVWRRDSIATMRRMKRRRGRLMLS